MIIDKEEHRAVLLLALRSIPISGPAGDPEMLRHVLAVHELIGLVEAASVPMDPSLEAYTDR